MVDNEPVEIAKEEADKTVYTTIYPEHKLKIVAKEVYKTKDEIVLHPYRVGDARNGDVVPKYDPIKKLVFEGYNRILPWGVRKTYRSGYGLTKDVAYMAYTLMDNYPEIESIVFSTSKKTKIQRKKFVVNSTDFEDLRKSISIASRIFVNSRNLFINNFFAKLAPRKFSVKKRKYVKGTISNAVEYDQDLVKCLSSKDKKALMKIFERLRFLKQIDIETLLKSEKIVQRIQIEEILKEYKKLLSPYRKNEEKWHKFFEKYTWIFSQLFHYQAVLFQSKAYAGGMRVDKQGANIADFLYQNELTKNVAIIEIKTHKTALLKKNPYRGNNVFELSKDLNGGINQILRQKHNLIADFKSLAHESEKEFGSFDPQCILIIGRLDSLSKKQKECFEIYRRSCKDLEILTYDELFARIDSILKIFDEE